MHNFWVVAVLGHESIQDQSSNAASGKVLPLLHRFCKFEEIVLAPALSLTYMHRLTMFANRRT